MSQHETNDYLLALSAMRRCRFLKFGVVGAMLSLPQLLRASSPYGSGPSQHSKKNCIFIMQQGGPSHIDTFDLKPDAPAEIRGPYKPINTSVPGYQICELLPRLAKLADIYCVIRSITTIPAQHPASIHPFLPAT